MYVRNKRITCRPSSPLTHPRSRETWDCTNRALEFYSKDADGKVEVGFTTFDIRDAHVESGRRA